jgi:putative polyhydroxyalkanoate system protein
MADIELDRTHHLGLKGAKTAADKMAAKLAEKFDLAASWEGDTLHFERPGVNGTLKISATEMHLRVTLGFMLKMMRSPIESAIHEQLDDVLDAEKPAVKTAAKPAAKSASKRGKA